MAKTPPPLLGFNNNVRHHGRIFHIQTEDSGVKRPHIITHLFGDGGRILKSVRTDYSEHLAREDMAQVVRRLMKEQHKAMFVALRSGELDDVIVAAFGPPAADAARPLPDAPARPGFESRVASPEEFAASSAPLPTPMPEEWQRALAAAELEQEAPPRAPTPLPEIPRLLTPPPTSRSIESAVEAMAAKVAGLPAPDAPPTPESGTSLAAPAALQRRRAPAETAGRYSVSRPSSIFGDAPAPDSRSIFGDSLIGEKSLDEVILSYLAEDLETPK